MTSTNVQTHFGERQKIRREFVVCCDCFSKISFIGRYGKEQQQSLKEKKNKNSCSNVGRRRRVASTSEGEKEGEEEEE